MVVPTDVQVAFIASCVFADWGRRIIQAEHVASAERSLLVRTRFRRMGTAYASLFLAPVVAVFFCAWPGWETQYWLARAERLAGNGVHALAAGGFLLLLVVAADAGSRLAFAWITAGRLRRLRAVYLAGLAATLAIFLAEWPAPVRLGSVESFRADPATLPFIWQDGEFLALFLALLAYCAVPYFILFFRLRRESMPLGRPGGEGSGGVLVPEESHPR